MVKLEAYIIVNANFISVAFTSNNYLVVLEH